MDADFAESQDELLQTVSSDFVSSSEGEESFIHTFETDIKEPFACSTPEDLINHCNRLAMQHGFVTSIKRSEQSKFAIVQCVRAGSHRQRTKEASGEDEDEDEPKVPQQPRKTSTKKCECLFRLRFNYDKRTGGYKLSDNASSMCFEHNHPVDVSLLSGYPRARRIRPVETGIVESLMRTSIPTRKIRDAVMESFPDSNLTSKDISNFKDKRRLEALQKHSPTQKFLDELEKGGYIYDYRIDESGRLLDAFLIHSASIPFLKAFPCVLLMDCTYKTNKYRMPLLDIVGFTGTNSTFFAALAFMSRETEEDYRWALGCLRKVMSKHGISLPHVVLTDRELALVHAVGAHFPSSKHILCRWHINKNVLAKCKPRITSNEVYEDLVRSFHRLVESPTIVVYEERRLDLLQFCESKDIIDVYEYIQTTWLPWKEKFVAAWVDDSLHLGQKNTSRVEGAHATLKKYIETSVADLYTGLSHVRQAISAQVKALWTEYNRQAVSRYIPARSDVFKELQGNVTTQCLDLLVQQWEQAHNVDNKMDCTNAFTRTHGIPCSHWFTEHPGTAIPFSDVHDHWKLQTLQPGEDVQGGRISTLDPVVQDQDLGAFTVARDHPLVDAFAKLKLLFDESTPEQQPRLVMELTKMAQTTPLDQDIKDPTRVSASRGRPAGSLNKSKKSTKREPSAFEVVIRAEVVAQRTQKRRRTKEPSISPRKGVLQAVVTHTPDSFVTNNTSDSTKKAVKKTKPVLKDVEVIELSDSSEDDLPIGTFFPFAVGQHIYALYHHDTMYYAGTITKLEGSRLHVQFYDDCQQVCSETDVRPVGFGIGDSVHLAGVDDKTWLVEGMAKGGFSLRSVDTTATRGWAKICFSPRQAQANDTKNRVFFEKSFLSKAQALIVSTSIASVTGNTNGFGRARVYLDVSTLKPKEWVSDYAINTFAALVVKNAIGESPCVCIDSLTLQAIVDGNASKQTQLSQSKLVSQVVDTGTTIFVVNMGQEHWLTAWLKFPTREMWVYDSLPGERYFEGVCKMLDRWLAFLGYEVEGWTRRIVNGPQQPNGYDCGVYTMRAIRCISEGRRIAFPVEDMTAFREAAAYQILTGHFLDL
jgi:hypothetical protein